MTTQHLNIDYKSLPVAADDWKGPFQSTYLGGYVNKTKKNSYRFEDFNVAVEYANKIDKCKGITMIYLRNKKIYELRVGTNGIIPANPQKIYTALASWIKN